MLFTAFIAIPSCGGVQLTKEQEEICTPEKSDTEIGKMFLEESSSLPEDVGCLRYPTKKSHKRTSRFRDSHHPFQPGRHTGTDYSMKPGTKIFAVASGTVKYARATANGVNIITVEVGDGWEFQVVHLTEIRVNKGDEVTRGQLIGLSGGAVGAPGSGPCTTGPHLHISVSHYRKYTNYEDLLCRRSSE